MTPPAPRPGVKPPTALETLLKERVALMIGGELAAIEAEISREIQSPVDLIRCAIVAAWDSVTLARSPRCWRSPAAWPC